MNLAPTRTVAVGPGVGIFDTNGFDSTLSQGVSGIGVFAKDGEGTLTLLGSQTNTGGTAVAGGTLRTGAANILNSPGGVRVGPAGTLDLAGFNQTVAQAINGGLIRTGGTGSTDLTVTGPYIGQGGTLALNTVLAGDASPSDRLVLSGAGASASGSSFLDITNIGGLGAMTVGPGILVVDAVGGATTTPGAFALAGPVVAGPYEYMLFRGDGNPDAWYLRSTLNCALDPTSPICAVSPGPGPSPVVPIYRQETSLYAALPAMTLLYGRVLLDTLHERMGEDTGPAGYGAPHGTWGRVIGQHGDRDGSNAGIYGSGPKYDYDFWAFQAGTDLYRSANSAGARDRAGAFFAIGNGSGDVTHVTDVKAGENTFMAYSWGGYWTHYTAEGAYLDGVLMGTFYDADAKSTRIPKLTTEGTGFGASLEGGYPFRFAGGFIIEPQAQIVYQTLNLHNSSDVGALVHFDDVNSLAGRLGIRFVQEWGMTDLLSNEPGIFTAWVRPNFWYEFLGDPKTSFSSETGFIPFEADLFGPTFEINTGFTAAVTSNTAVYANASYLVGIGGSADGNAYDGKLGLRIAW